MSTASRLTRRLLIALLLVHGIGGNGAQAQTRPSPLVLVVGDSLSAEYGLRRGTGWVALLEQAQTRPSPLVLVVGDSLSAEYGLRRGTGWVALLEQRLAKERHSVRVVNASISGDTTSGGRSRLGPLLRQHQPSVVVIELGGNDALRGLPLTMTRDNLNTMAQQARAAGARVLLLGMEMPPNYGARYGEDFRLIYRDVARTAPAALVPFFLKGIADGPNPTALFQADRIHPNESAQARMLDNAWPELRKLLPPR